MILSPVLIDGYTQPGSSPNTIAQGALNTVLKIVLSGSNIPGQTGLSIATNGAGSTIRGLVVNGGFNNGILSSSSNGNTVRGCFVGVNAAGTTTSPNTSGIGTQFSNDFTVGGSSPADRNLLSGQTRDQHPDLQLRRRHDRRQSHRSGHLGRSGSRSDDPRSLQATNTEIRGNVVGGATVGMTLGKTADAITGLTVHGNWVGTDVTETADLGNLRIGVLVNGRDITIGGVKGPGEGNVIAFNGESGVFVNWDFSNITGNTIRGNSIYSNGEGANSGSCLHSRNRSGQ